MIAPAVAWVQVEQAMRQWLISAIGLPDGAVYFVEKASVGQPPPVPAVQIQPGAMVPRFQPEARQVPSVVLVRATVIGPGPGSAGVLFYAGSDLVPQTISVAAGPAEPAETIAANLLAELSANLPAGYSASADPDNAASVLVMGSDAEPLFSMVTAAPALVSVSTIRERFPVLDCAWTRFSWRVVFRSAVPRGPGSHSDMLAAARMTMQRKLAPALHAAGHRLAGVNLAAPNIPADREEFRGALDFNTEGYATRVYQTPAARQIGHDFTHA